MIVRRPNLVTFYTILIVLSLIAGRQKQAEAGESSSSSSPPPNEDSDNNDTNSQDDEQSGCEVDLFRLPARIQPVHYDLLVMPDLASNSFEGAIQISLSIGNYNNKSNNFNESVDSLLAPNQIALHASKYLSLDHVWYLEQRNKSSAAPKLNRDANNTLHQLLSETKQQANRTDLVGNDAGAYIEVLKVCRVPNFDMIIVSLAQDLRPNSMGLLHFTFSGDLSADTFGVYLSSWSVPPGAAKVSGGRKETNGSNVVSQFEATSAREMFPCFDEPEIKATFELSLIHRANKTALANTLPTYEHMLRMPVLSVTSANGPTAAKNATKFVQEEEEEEEEFRLVRYARTPPMSAYLLAFTVGDYEFIEDFVQLKSKKLRVRVYTTPGEINKAQFALQTATKAIKVLQKMFDDEYPLDKIDLVGVVDLRFEAMGNWGIIMVKQQELLVDPASSSAYGRASTASLIIHELAHQWSGNLVTMRWWNDLWQHEGFTAWMENKILGEVYPELEQSQLFEQSRANNSGAGKETKMRIPNSLSHVIAHLFNSQKPASSK